MKMNKKLKKGFTLVELVVVIAVIAILAAVSVGAYFGVTESAKKSQAQQEGKALHTNMLLVANDPANTSKAVFGKTGIVLPNDKLEAFETEVEAATGLGEDVYNFVIADPAEGEAEAGDVVFGTISASKTFTAGVTAGATTTTYAAFKYYVDASHYAIFDIVTGAQA